MAVQSNSGNEYQKPKSSGGGKKLARTLFGPHTYLKKGTRLVISVVFALLILACLFGFINQRATGESIFEWVSNAGNEIGNGIMKVFNDDEDKALSVGDQGIYVNGYEPDDQQEIFDNEKEDENN